MIRRYLLLVGLPAALGLAWLAWPHAVPAADAAAGAAAVAHGGDAASLLARLQQPLPHFLLQLLAVLVLAKAAGIAMKRLGQPAVIGEMLAGIALGPSLFGLLLPLQQQWLFPAGGLGPLKLLAQLGVLVFLFAAGAEFQLAHIRGQRRKAVLIGHAGIAVPFVFGLAVAPALFAAHAPAGTDFVAFALFLGVSLSVTAFPVLLRILDERGYRGRPIATLAVAVAAIADASAWAILGAVVAWTQSSGVVPLATSLAAVALLAWALLAGLRPRLAAVDIAETSAPAMVAMVLLALACALFTELMDLHLLFGAFLAGLAVSGSPSLRAIVVRRIEPFAVVLLLPLFFASTGLATRIDLLDGGEWLWCAALTVLATAGKFGGTWLAARGAGIERRDALRLGALMNTRGLMELIVLGLGYELGLIDQRLYAMLVIVAIVTTVLTGPLLSLIDRRGLPTPAT